MEAKILNRGFSGGAVGAFGLGFHDPCIVSLRKRGPNRDAIGRGDVHPGQVGGQGRIDIVVFDIEQSSGSAMGFTRIWVRDPTV